MKLISWFVLTFVLGVAAGSLAVQFRLANRAPGGNEVNRPVPGDKTNKLLRGPKGDRNPVRLAVLFSAAPAPSES